MSSFAADADRGRIVGYAKVADIDVVVPGGKLSSSVATYSDIKVSRALKECGIANGGVGRSEYASGKRPGADTDIAAAGCIISRALENRSPHY